MTNIIEMQDFRAWRNGTRLLLYCLPPIPIVRWKCDEDLPFGVGGDIVEEKVTLAFFRAPLAERDQAAQAPVGFAVCWKTEKAEAVCQIEPRADDKTQARLLRGNMRAHDTGKRVAICDGDGRKPQRFGLRHELFSVRAAAQKRKIARDLKLRVTHLFALAQLLRRAGRRRMTLGRRHANTPCRNQRGGSPSPLSSSAPP